MSELVRPEGCAYIAYRWMLSITLALQERCRLPDTYDITVPSSHHVGDGFITCKFWSHMLGLFTGEEPSIRCQLYTISPLSLLCPPAARPLDPTTFFQQWSSAPSGDRRPVHLRNGSLMLLR